MSFRTILNLFVASTLILGCIATAGATTVVFDDFNDDGTGTLTGETTNTGQTWIDIPYDTWVDAPMETGTAYGQGGTVGAGYAAANHRGSYLPIPPLARQTLMDMGGGSYAVGFDMTKGEAVEVGLELVNAEQKAISFVWWNDQLSLGGSIDLWDIGIIEPRPDGGGGTIHVDFTIDVEASGDSTAIMSYYGIADPDGVPYTDENRPSGSLQGTSSADFAYTGVVPWAAGGSEPTGGAIAAGFDNLLIGILDPVPGDANRNGDVDEEDAAILASNWLMQTDATWTDGDFNGDNKVDDIDATMMAVNWGAASTTASTVPEPAVLSLLLTGLCGLLVTGVARRRSPRA